jgi:hypothetical protein
MILREARGRRMLIRASSGAPRRRWARPAALPARPRLRTPDYGLDCSLPLRAANLETGGYAGGEDWGSREMMVDKATDRAWLYQAA